MASRDIVLGDPDAAFAEADGTISGHVPSARITGTAIEPARLRRLLRRLCADVHVLGLDAEPPPAAQLHRRDAGRAGDLDPGHPATRRRGLRSQDPDVPGGAARRLPLAQARAAGEVDRGAERELPDRRPRARHALSLRGRLQERRHRDGHPPRGDRRRRRSLRALRLGHVVRHWYCLPCVYKIPNSETHLRVGRDEQVPVERRTAATGRTPPRS